MRLSLFSKSDSVLLVGEGNFSFSVSLVKQKLPIEVTSTCFEAAIVYEQQLENIEFLKSKNVPVFLNVDATKLHKNANFQNKFFTKIIFNFPHICGKMKIHLNRKLIKEFFESASHLISRDGLLIISLCQGQGGTPLDKPQRRWDDSWQITEMAAHGNFILTSVEPFEPENFKEYHCVGYRRQGLKFNLKGALVHCFVKAEPPYACINERVVMKRLSLVPLKENSSVFTSIIYHELYNNNPLQNPDSPFSFLKDLLFKDLRTFLSKAEWKILSDLDIPVYIQQEKGVGCAVNSNKTEFSLRSHPKQIFNTVFELLKNLDLKNNIVFYPGMYFKPLFEKNFTRILPVEFQFLIIGKNILESIKKHINNLFDIFKEQYCTYYFQKQDTELDCNNHKTFGINSVTELVYEVKQKGKKFTPATIYILDYNTINVEAVIINPQEILSFFFDIKDLREIWTESNKIIVQHGAKPILKQKMIHSLSYTFDVTLRYNSNIGLPDEQVYKILWLVGCQLVENISLISKYVSAEDWSSKCYRITYKSLDRPLFRNRALDIHSKLVSQMLAVGLDVKIG